MTNVLVPFGSCARVTWSGGVLGNITRQVLARRVLTDYTLGIKVFAGGSCVDFIQDYGTMELKSGTCIKSPFEDYIMVSYLDPMDGPDSRRLTYRSSCEPRCGKCDYHGDSALDDCISFG